MYFCPACQICACFWETSFLFLVKFIKIELKQILDLLLYGVTVCREAMNIRVYRMIIVTRDVNHGCTLLALRHITHGSPQNFLFV